MNRKQAKWATEHDWCLNVIHTAPDQWIALVRDDELPTGCRVFTNFTEMKHWAGY